MATAFMKWLETKPGWYDRGIRLLTLGRLAVLHEDLVERCITADAHALDLGCGTGLLSLAMATAGAQVDAIDIDPGMLAFAEQRTRDAGLTRSIEYHHMDAARIADQFDPGSFDVIASSLAFSEMSLQTQRHVLAACRVLLKPDGILAVIDEMRPQALVARLAAGMIRTPLRGLTWLLTRTTTAPWAGAERALARAGFDVQAVRRVLGGTLALVISRPAPEAGAARLPAVVQGRLSRRTNWRTKLLDLWALFFRIIPPYPKLTPGLYALGNPNDNAPVLVTGNYELTVRRLVNAVDGYVDAWLLVVDSGGINVWCAAGGGFLTAEKVVGALSTSELGEVVRHRALILPQLCANGVDGWRIREESGWGVHWGPVRAEDIPAYLRAGCTKGGAMRHVRFPLRDRLEMMAATLGFYGLLILLPIAIFWRGLFLPTLFGLAGLSLVYAIFLPWLPGKDGLEKSLPLAVIALLGMGVYSTLFSPAPPPQMFNRALGMLALSVFVGAEMQGMSPLMRGEQANWLWEGVIGLVLVLLYWVVPLWAGWR
jgi:ubiquinone/menaquinone biosynthesis C-methylase UbiE